MRFVESRLPRFNPGGFDDTCSVFTLAHDKVRESRLSHTHFIGAVLRQPIAHIRRGQNPGDVLR